MNKFNITVSKGTVSYGIEAENEELALDMANELYNQRDFEVEEVEEIKDPS